MNVDEYQEKVIALFKSGKATPEQWNEMAASVLNGSEIHESVPLIDATIYPEQSQTKEGTL